MVGTVDGCGYDSQLKYTICDACRPCHSIVSILEPVFHQLRQIHCTFNSLRCLDVEIWRFLWWHRKQQTDRQTDYFTPAYTHGIIIIMLWIILVIIVGWSIITKHSINIKLICRYFRNFRGDAENNRQTDKLITLPLYICTG